MSPAVVDIERRAATSGKSGLTYFEGANRSVITTPSFVWLAEGPSAGPCIFKLSKAYRDAIPVPKKYYINTRDKPGLLIAIMREFVGTGEISFEGFLGDTGLDLLPGAFHSETAALRHSSLSSDKPNFLVVPLTEDNVSSIRKVITEKEHLGSSSNIRHVQLSVGGKFVFGAYDNFHRDCVVATERIPLKLLDKLSANGVIRSYEIAPDEEPIIVGAGPPVAT